MTGPDGARGRHAERGEPGVSAETMIIVFECPSCEERITERRCAECNVFARRLGPGGGCPACGEIVLAVELEGEL